MLGARVCLLGMVSLLVTGSRCRITRKRGEHGQGAQTSQRPETLVHFVIPPRTRWQEPRDRPMHAVRTSQKLPHRRFSTVTFGQQRGENVARAEQNVVAPPVRVVMPPFVKSVMRPDLIMSTCFVLQLRDMTSHAARLKDQNIVATARARDASHQNRSGNHARNRLRRGCSAIRPICCIRMSSREHAAEFATFAGHSAKMPRGDFSAKGRNRMTDQCRLARNLLERCSLFARGRQQAGVPCPIPC